VSELLTGSASDWYRVSQLQGSTWTYLKREFLEFFLPPRYFQRLEDQIRARQQRAGETFKRYLVELRLLMKRASFPEEQELERIYENLMPEYQLYIRSHEKTSLAQLTQLATNLEFKEREALLRDQAGPPQTLATINTRNEAAPPPRHRNPFRDN
ncbi:hypothetical protein KR044_010358, partial [Drosophila immigrans]